jgi:hypothetical protein
VPGFYVEDFNREFYVGLMVGGRDDGPQFWTSEDWPEWTNAFEPLISGARGEAAAEGCLIANWTGPMEGQRFVEYGSKCWSAPPPDIDVLANWSLSAPSARICRRERRSPDVYGAVMNLHFAPDLVLKARASALVAVACDLPAGNELFAAAIAKISQILPATLVAQKRRPWGFETGLGYNCGIGDNQWLNLSLLRREMSSDILTESWDTVEGV